MDKRGKHIAVKGGNTPNHDASAPAYVFENSPIRYMAADGFTTLQEEGELGFAVASLHAHLVLDGDAYVDVDGLLCGSWRRLNDGLSGLEK